MITHAATRSDNIQALAVLSDRPQEYATSPIPFFHFVERLKRVKREGWRRIGIQDAESIADHMYRMSIMTMLAPAALRSKLDLARCSKMALVHDMAEALVGDITPADHVPKKEKSRREEATMDYIRDVLLVNADGGESGKALKAAWLEYEESQTLESLFVHDIDKIELILQVVEYERNHANRPDLSEFLQTATKLVLPEMKGWMTEILKEREVLWKSRGIESHGLSEEAAKTLREQFGSDGQ